MAAISIPLGFAGLANLTHLSMSWVIGRSCTADLRILCGACLDSEEHVDTIGFCSGAEKGKIEASFVERSNDRGLHFFDVHKVLRPFVVNDKRSEPVLEGILKVSLTFSRSRWDIL